MRLDLNIYSRYMRAHGEENHANSDEVCKELREEFAKKKRLLE
jgi:hypothetical protein